MFNGDKARVLVVDDEPQMLVAFGDELGDDFDVVTIGSPEKAISLIEHERDLAVVVSDQRMPQLTGDQLFALLTERSLATRILTTAYADLSAVIRAVNRGRIFGYVTKPWNPDELRLLVHRGVQHFRLTCELENERKLLHDLMGNIPDGIYFKDRSLRFLRVNRPVAALLNGGNPEALVGKRVEDVCPERHDVLAMEEDERRVLGTGEPVLDALRVLDRNGGRVWLSETRAPIRDTIGEVMGIVGISRDVTARIVAEEGLRASEERLQLTFRASAAGLFEWNVGSSEMSYSPSFEALLGHDEGKLGRSAADALALVHPEDAVFVAERLSSHLRERAAFRDVELRARTRGGEYRWFSTSAQAVWDSDGSVTRLAGSINDITERKEQEERLARLTRMHSVLSGINSTILRTEDRRRLLEESCRIAVEVGELDRALVFVVAPDEAKLELVAWRFSGRADSGLAPAITSLLEAMVPDVAASRRALVINDLGASGAGRAWMRRGGALRGAIAAFPLFVAGRMECLFALSSDRVDTFDGDEEKLLTELADNISFALDHIAQAERLSFLAYHDGLTSLPNRDALVDRMKQRMEACRATKEKVAVLLIDLERFRQVNATLGRRAGDELLTQVAVRLTTAPLDLLARLEGSAFAVVLEPTKDEAAAALFVEEEIAPRFKEAFSIEDTELRISARVGIAVYPNDGIDADTLLENAEAALKTAKLGGDKYVFYSPELNAKVAERLTLETNLRRAIEAEEFLLHYQPKVELKTGRVAGLEALIRWQDGEGELVPPGRFVPVLEETGMIAEVGHWVLRRAAAQYSEWFDRGLTPPRIAVNVSTIQLAQSDFVHTIERTIADYPQAASGLDLEITESVFAGDLVGNVEKLRAARALGFEVAIDDFGTGYSSFGYLSRLPIDALKIDRSFVIRMADDPHDTTIVTTMISMAHALDLKVIAEGVETPHQAQLLRLLKCDQIQGYLCAKPQSPGAIEPFLGATLSLARAIVT